MLKKRLHTDKMIESELLVNDLKRLFDENSIMEEQMGDTAVFVMEKYFLRNNNYASCTICMKQNETGTELILFSNGAGSGLWNITFGSTEDLMDGIENIIQKYL